MAGGGRTASTSAMTLSESSTATAPPRVLLVNDAHGPVVLAGCRSTGSTSTFRAGRGVIVANFAVLGGTHLRYEQVHGLRTEVPALAAWTQLSSMTVDYMPDEVGRMQSVQMKLTNAEPISLARRMNLKMRSSWRTEQPDGGFLAYEGVELETLMTRPRRWEDHLVLHRAGSSPRGWCIGW